MPRDHFSSWKHPKNIRLPTTSNFRSRLSDFSPFYVFKRHSLLCLIIPRVFSSIIDNMSAPVQRSPSADEKFHDEFLDKAGSLNSTNRSATELVDPAGGNSTMRKVDYRLLIILGALCTSWCYSLLHLLPSGFFISIRLRGPTPDF